MVSYGPFWEFIGNNVEGILFGEGEIEATRFKVKGRVFSRGKHRVAGFVEGKVEIGTDHMLDRVTFHLPNYPDFMGNDDFSEIVTNGTKITSKRWSEIVLDADGWRIALQPHQDIFTLRQKAREGRTVVLSGIGEIRRVDGGQFKRKQVGPLLKALRIFLSFSFAEWSPPLLAVGSNKIDEKSYQMWANYDVSPQSILGGWIDEHHGQHLPAAFPGFLTLWNNEKWQEPLELAVNWLIETSRQAGGTEGAIAFGQIPLEMLAWMVFVDDRAIVQANEFEKLSAASKLQMLLAHCGIPFDVPPGLTELGILAKKTKLTTGPQLATKVRNTIIHPKEMNRKLLLDWEKGHGIKVADVRWETQQLFKWYITLVLLSLIGYEGDYANRLTPHKLGEVESVPWATCKKKVTTI